MAKLQKGNLSLLTDKQRQIAELLASQPQTGYTQKTIAEMCDISERQIQRYKKDRNFQLCVIELSIDATAGYIPSVLETLAKKAVKGENKSIELFLKAYGMLTDTSVVETTVTTEQSQADIMQEIKRLGHDLKDMGVSTDIIDQHLKKVQ